MSKLEIDITHQYRNGFKMRFEISLNALSSAIIGPSGSGKTSLFSFISGIRKPQKGSISIGGREVLNTEKKYFCPPHHRHTGVVFQDGLLFPHLTVRSNLRYGMARQTERKNGISFDNVVEVLELQEFIDRYPNSLSGGQRQRVALGRAILSKPDLLLLDEPFSALDHELKSKIIDYFERAFCEWHIPTVYISHDLDDVERLADEVFVVENGSVVESGTLHSLTSRFSGSSGLSIFPGEMVEMKDDKGLSTAQTEFNETSGEGRTTLTKITT